MIILETPRLVLRHLEPADLDALFALYRDPETRRYYPDGTRTRAETEEELNYFRNGHPEHPELGLWATVEQGSGTFLGRCGLLPWKIDGRDEVELACLIDKARWREGLASEAALAMVQYAKIKLRLSRLICVITHGNTASVGLAEKVGMAFERDCTDEYGPFMLYSRSLDV